MAHSEEYEELRLLSLSEDWDNLADNDEIPEELLLILRGLMGG